MLKIFHRSIIATALALTVWGCDKPVTTIEATPVIVKPTAAETPTQPVTDRPKLVAMGDSLTEGLGVALDRAYPAQLQKRLDEAGIHWEVINAGISGETSSGAKTRLNWVLRTEPEAILLVTGINDALRGVDPEIIRGNIDAIVAKLKEKGVKVMIGGMKSLPNFGAEYGEKFERIYPELAQKHSVPLIPFFLDGVARVPSLNQKDGKHPTEEGYTKVVDHIFDDVRVWLQSEPEA